MERLLVDDAQIEYEVRGEGEPVLLIHPGGFADGLARPLFAQPDLAARYRLIHYHRRGYVGSTRGRAPLTLARQAAEAAALLSHLGLGSAHVVGHSIAGVIALQLALVAPDRVHSLALLEPALRPGSESQAQLAQVLAPARAQFQAGNNRRPRPRHHPPAADRGLRGDGARASRILRAASNGPPSGRVNARGGGDDPAPTGPGM